jgi:hypothetical protein
MCSLGKYVFFSFATSFILGTRLPPNTLGRSYQNQGLCEMLLEYVEANPTKIYKYRTEYQLSMH